MQTLPCQNLESAYISPLISEDEKRTWWRALSITFTSEFNMEQSPWHVVKIRMFIWDLWEHLTGQLFVVSTVWGETPKLLGGINIAKCLQVKCSYRSQCDTISHVYFLWLFITGDRTTSGGCSSATQQVSNPIQIKQKGFLWQHGMVTSESIDTNKVKVMHFLGY